MKSLRRNPGDDAGNQERRSPPPPAVYVAHGGSGDAVLGVAIWGSPQKPKHSALTLLRSGLWAGPVRLGIPAWRRRQALAPVLAALKPPGPCWYLNGRAEGSTPMVGPDLAPLIESGGTRSR